MQDRAFALHHLIRLPLRPQNSEGAPLLLLLHGFAQNEDAMHRLAPMLDERFCVVSVRAPIELGVEKYAWARARFTPDGPEDDAGDFETSRSALLRFLDELLAAYDLDAERVYLMGFSQGASLALGLAMSQAERFAGAVATSGKLLEQYLEAADPPAALNDLPILMAHGSHDRLVPIRRARRDHEVLADLPVDLTYREYPMDHEMSFESLGGAAAWLKERLGTASSGVR